MVSQFAIAEFYMNILLSLNLFATHYHELNEMSESCSLESQNYNVAVKELKDTVLFVRKLGRKCS
jgi:DNA mismatch repair protein MutS